MSELDPLMERLNEMHGQMAEIANDKTTPLGSAVYMSLNYDKLCKALEAVLAVPESQYLGNDGPRQKLAVDCYNMALSDVRTAIAEALGVEG